MRRHQIVTLYVHGLSCLYISSESNTMPQFNKYSDQTTGWRLSESKFDSWQDYTQFPSPERPDYLVDHPATHSMGNANIFSRIKWSERESNYSLLNEKVKNEWTCTSTLPYVFMAQFLNKQRDKWIPPVSREPYTLSCWKRWPFITHP